MTRDDDRDSAILGCTSEDRASQLSAEKLQLEIRALRQPWRYSASHIAAAASIAAAVLTIGWGVFSGVFDLTRRELEVRRAELRLEVIAIREKRDQQSMQFLNDRRVYIRQITELRQRLDRYDKPIAIHATVEKAPWLAARDGTAPITLYLLGANFGTSKPIGGLLAFSYACPGAFYLPSRDLKARVVGRVEHWGDDYVRLEFAQQDVAKRVSQFLNKHSGLDGSLFC